MPDFTETPVQTDLRFAGLHQNGAAEAHFLLELDGPAGDCRSEIADFANPEDGAGERLGQALHTEKKVCALAPVQPNDILRLPVRNGIVQA
ncbi:MAG: hypothetical protein MUC33_16645 [Desulfobacterales bacterium]|nr:hypothetical protein [Desulfobacterales bacterium]